MNRLAYYFGSALCALSEICYLLTFAFHATGVWFRTPTKKPHNQESKK